MDHATPFAAPFSQLPTELVAEVASYLQGDDTDVCKNVLHGRFPHSKDVSSFALVSKQFGAAQLKASHSVVYGAKSWELGEDTPRASGTPMAKLNLRPWNTYQCSLLGSTFPTCYIRTVVLAPPHDGGEDFFFNVSPRELREVLLALPRLEKVIFAQTVALNVPVLHVCNGPVLKVSYVHIQQRGGNTPETLGGHLPRLLSIFDEIEELEYSSNHTEDSFTVSWMPLVKVSKLRLWSINQGRPSGALRAMSFVLDCAVLQAIKFRIDSWTMYQSCAPAFNAILKKASNLQELSLDLPGSYNNHWSCDPCRDYCLRYGRNRLEGDSAMTFIPATSINLSVLTNLQALRLRVAPYACPQAWDMVVDLYGHFAKLNIQEFVTEIFYFDSNGKTPEKTEGQDSLTTFAENIKDIFFLSDGFHKLRRFVVALWAERHVYSELRGAFDAYVLTDRVNSLIQWRLNTWDDNDSEYDEIT